MTAPFFFRGTVPASKSILNRLLVLQSYEPSLNIQGLSTADDVLKMRSALNDVLSGRVADCGAAGTTFRFLALRASRIPGKHRLVGTHRLLERPQNPLVQLLELLGCHAALDPDGLTVEGHGWMIPKEAIKIDRSISSQFASAVVLNSWNLPKELNLELSEDSVSEGYLQMTIQLARRLGLKIEECGRKIKIAPFSRAQNYSFQAEPDLSSAFAVAALAAVSKGQCEILNWPEESMQPDAAFVEILRNMGCDIKINKQCLAVKGPERLRAVEVNLCHAPDLFPVLAVLCATAHGTSRLFGAPHLVHKESNRIEKTGQLLQNIGVNFVAQQDGISIDGIGGFAGISKICAFNPSEDHRLVMAAAVALRAGANFEILHSEAVDKSFPEFWKVANSTVGVLN